MFKRAVVYRIGSVTLSSLIAWAILAALRGSEWSSLSISVLTSVVLLFTHTGYYMIFHKLWTE